MAIEVILTPDEMYLGAAHGVLRRFQKYNAHRGDRVQKEESSWDNEINGAIAEVAFCKWRGIYWTGVKGIRAKDGGECEVRWTRHKDKGGLIVYNHDKADCRFILAVGTGLHYRMIGWIDGADAKLHAKPTSFGNLLPRKRLHPLND